MGMADDARNAMYKVNELPICICDLVIEYAYSSAAEKMTVMISERIKNELTHWYSSYLVCTEDISVIIIRALKIEDLQNLENYSISISYNDGIGWKILVMSVNDFIQSIKSETWITHSTCRDTMHQKHAAAIRKTSEKAGIV